ncbi:hypothetical protein BCON_0167g00030 [Botryotinia convoluta]|uniref:SET domain-containing protein n=1 Tax=Botryotinia convoluta TaxID=54673 RepID=A0A4Z1HQU6_9HELO|nr:hypothetical protein BCON_0167g00030 [Botryotinia convoluta]
MSSSEPEPMYSVQEVSGKGKGLIATRTIPMGTCILAEEPIIRIPEDASDTAVLRVSIRKQVEALTANKRQAFLSMHNIYANDATSPHLGIIRTNRSWNIINACRINHACDNNAQKGWNENTKRHTIYAKRDIESGEEITIFHLGVLNKRETRQQRLRSKFAFTCSCHLCSLPLDPSQAIDKKLEEILKLDERISQDGMMGILSVPLLKLRYVDQQVRLYNELGPNDTGLPSAFYDAAQIPIANGDLARARIFVQKAVKGWTVLDGESSPSVLQYSELYGMSKKWKMAVNEVPTGLGEEEWENWLWRRKKKTRRPGNP